MINIKNIENYKTQQQKYNPRKESEKGQRERERGLNHFAVPESNTAI